MLSIGRAHAETSCERIFQAQLSEKTLRNIVNTWHMNHTISYNFYRFATCFLKSLKFDLIFLQCWKIAVSSTSHTITGPDPRARHFFNPGTKAAVTRALRRSQSDASFFASESSTLRPGIVDHGGSWWIIDHVWSDWVAPSRKSERTSMGFVDLLGVLQLLPCEDAEVYHQLTENICAFHCLPSQLAAQLTFELLLHHVIDWEKRVHPLILTTTSACHYLLLVSLQNVLQRPSEIHPTLWPGTNDRN